MREPLLSLVNRKVQHSLCEELHPPPSWTVPALLSAEEHVDQQLQQVGLAYHGPEEEFSDEAGRDALQQGGCEEDSSEALLAGLDELDHLAEGVLGLLLQAFHKESCL